MADKFAAGIVQNSTSVSVPVELWTSTTHLPLTSLVFGSVAAGYWRQGAAFVTITLVSTAVTGAWISGGWCRLSADAVGAARYRLDVPDAAFASGVDFVTVVSWASGGFGYQSFFPLIGIGETAKQVALSSLTVRGTADTVTLTSLLLYTTSLSLNVASLLVYGASHTVALTSLLLYTTSLSLNVASLLVYGASHTVALNSILLYTSSTSLNVASLLTYAASHTVALTSILLYTSSTTVAVASALVWVASNNAAIYTRASAAVWTAVLAGSLPLVSDFTSAASLVALTWDNTTASHTTAGTMGKALGSAGAAADPWATYVPGTYSVGTAGQIIGSLLDIGVSSRATGTVWTSVVASRINASLDAAISAASLALTAYAPLTTVHGDAIAASTALAAYTGVSVALTAYGISTLVARIDDTITSRASAALWTSVVASRINASMDAAISAASLALTAYAPLTTAHGDAIAASTALTALGFSAGYAALMDAPITSRASASLWTSTVAGRIDAAITTRASASVWTSVLAGSLALVSDFESAASLGIAISSLTVTAVLAGIIDGTFDLQTTLKEVLAYVSGKVTKAGDVYTYKDRSESTTLFTNTVAVGGRTRT
jgi:hypothetical protein